MRTTTPLTKQANPFIGRDKVRFGDTPRRAPHRMRRPPLRALAIDFVAPANTARYAHQFMTAFTGGLIFFSILIF